MPSTLPDTAALARLLQDGQPESQHREYKRQFDLENPESRAKAVRAAAAMANGGGGVIIIQ